MGLAYVVSRGNITATIIWFAITTGAVAHVVELATLVYPSKFGIELVNGIEKWSKWVIEKAKEQIGDLYEPINKPNRGGALIPIAYLWTRTVKCKNPRV